MRTRILLTYRTRDGAADYCFSAEEEAENIWRVYIVSQPDYNGQPEGPEQTHRLTADDGRKYICWTVDLPTLGAAKSVAASWADETQKYRRGLPAFDQQS